MISKGRNLFFYGIAAFVVLVDQITKAMARNNLASGDPVNVIPGLLKLELSYNSGAAFGMLPNWAPLLVIVTLVAVFAIVRLRSANPQKTCLTVGLAMLLGGAIGNLIDRLSPSHTVTDFISMYVDLGGNTHTWPTFNVADMGVVIGALLMFYYVYILEKRQPETE